MVVCVHKCVCVCIVLRTSNNFKYLQQNKTTIKSNKNILNLFSYFTAFVNVLIPSYKGNSQM